MASAQPRSTDSPIRALPAVGEIIGEKYRIESILGRGGMGAVFLARHVITERAVAIKWMLPEGGADAGERFLQEAKAMGRIDHPGVVGVFDVGLDDGAAYLVMELLRGSSLRELMPRGKTFDAAEAIGLLMPALEGLDAAHRAGVLHRDVKPENIFVVRASDGSVATTKVVDFGISKLRRDPLGVVDGASADVLTQTGVAMGTPMYMSPEQLRGSRDVDARSDVWAIGVVLYELLAGRPPFRGDSFGNLLLTIVTEAHEPLASVRVDLPPLLCAVVDVALAKNVDGRPPSMAQLAHALVPFGATDLKFRSGEVPVATPSTTASAPTPIDSEIRQNAASREEATRAVRPAPVPAAPPIAKPTPTAGGRPFRVTVAVRATPQDIVRFCDEYRTRARPGAPMLIDATATTSYSQPTVVAVKEQFLQLAETHGLEMVVAIVPASLPRMGARAVAMSLRVLGAKPELRVVATEAEAVFD